MVTQAEEGKTQLEADVWNMVKPRLFFMYWWCAKLGVEPVAAVGNEPPQLQVFTIGKSVANTR